MSCKYNIILTKFPADGIKIALKCHSQSSQPPLTIVASAGISCAFAFGYETPLQHRGFLGLLHYPINSLASLIEHEGRKYSVIFPAGNTQCAAPNAEYLDRIRSRLSEQGEVTLILEYSRAEYDIPPLTPLDSVTCFWEVSDLLTDPYVDAVKYISERVLNESPKFNGLCIYSRNQTPEKVDARKKEIEEAMQIVHTMPLLQV